MRLSKQELPGKEPAVEAPRDYENGQLLAMNDPQIMEAARRLGVEQL